MSSLNSDTRVAVSHRSLPRFPSQFRLFPRNLFPTFNPFFLQLSRRGRVQEMKTAAAPRHSHRGHSIYLSLAARPPFFFLTVPPVVIRSPFSSLILFRSRCAVFPAWRISRNPTERPSRLGFRLFCPARPPFSKRALKEKRT